MAKKAENLICFKLGWMPSGRLLLSIRSATAEASSVGVRNLIWRRSDLPCPWLPRGPDTPSSTNALAGQPQLPLLQPRSEMKSTKAKGEHPKEKKRVLKEKELCPAG